MRANVGSLDVVRRRVARILGALILLGACGDATTAASSLPFYKGRLPRASVTLAGVDVTLRASATTVKPGDSVFFNVTATNRSAVRVQLGQACGPMMDVAVLAPTGGEQSAVVGDRADVVFTCPLPSDFFAAPGEARTIQIGWRAPALVGRYEARGGLRRGDGLGNESEILPITVR